MKLESKSMGDSVTELANTVFFRRVPLTHKASGRPYTVLFLTYKNEDWSFQLDDELTIEKLQNETDEEISALAGAAKDFFWKDLKTRGQFEMLVNEHDKRFNYLKVGLDSDDSSLTGDDQVETEAAAK